MASRLELQTVLEGLTENVYFQPPANITMLYPCIVYERSDSWSEYADNQIYAHYKSYQVTVIDRDPDSELPDLVESLPYCRFSRYFAADNLNHYVFNLFF